MNVKDQMIELDHSFNCLLRKSIWCGVQSPKVRTTNILFVSKTVVVMITGCMALVVFECENPAQVFFRLFVANIDIL